ncbi:MAG: hypothetical protein K2Q22_02405, partial [Cytophagales bacterium]|nr:hypothetical protein [Cytophagales bacterium]
ISNTSFDSEPSKIFLSCHVLYYLEAMVEFDHFRHGGKNDLVIFPYKSGIDSCKSIVFKKSTSKNLNENCSFSSQQYCVDFCNKNMLEISKNQD